MVIRLFSGFSTNDTGFFAGEAQAVSGSSVVTWRSTGQFFIPFGVTGFASGTFQYSGAVQQLTDDLNALSLTFPPTIFEVRYDNAINRIVISSSNAPYRIEFNASLQRTFGLDQEYFSPQSKVITGSVAPYFVWTSTQDSRANDTFPYEQTPYVTERLSDSGIAYSIGRRTVEKRRDWEFILEPKSNVFATFSSSLEPFNWERFIKNLRERPNPFVLMEDVTGSTVFYDDREAFYEMRAEAMNFKPRSAADIDYHEFWSVPVRTRVHFPRHRDRKEIESGLPCPVPTAPAVIYPSDMAVSVSLLPGLTQVLLSWSQPSPVTNYNVYFGTDPTPDIGEFVATTTDNFFSASVTGSNKVYYWKVDSTNDCGVRTNDVWSFRTEPSSCVGPFAVPATPISPTGGAVSQSITLTPLSWSAASLADTYDVYFGTSEPLSLLTSSVTDQTASITSQHPLSGSTEYLWRIDSVSACGNTTGTLNSFTTGTTLSESLLSHISSDKLIGYWKTDPTYVTQGGGTVQYMEDLTGNGWTLGNAGTDATWNATDSDFNGLPSITFTDPQRLTSSFIPRNGGVGPMAQSGSCIGIVMRPLSTVNDQYYMMWGSVAGAPARISITARDTTFLRVDMTMSGTTGLRRMDTGETFNTTSSYTFMSQIENLPTPADVQLYQNGVEGTKNHPTFPPTLNNKINDGPVIIAAGDPYNAESDTSLTFVEAFICKDVLTETEHQDMLDYVLRTYGIVSGST